MFRSLSRKRRFGFTLVEVLVTTVVIGVLAAVVLPALARQTSAADPARLSSDLNNIKMGIEVFSQNMRPDYPGDLEDLVNAPGASDQGADGAIYPTANLTDWKGPYVAQALPVVTTGTGSTSWNAGAAGFFENDIQICDLAFAAICNSVSTTSQFITVQMNGLTATEAKATDTMLDGAESATGGMFRYETSGTPAYYYTIPYLP